MIDVSTNHLKAGRLSRLHERGTSFVYTQLSGLDNAVSLTMPLQPQSWDWDYGLLPIFEMNLPEGALRASLQNRFAKALGHFDALDLLAITGRHQIGRLQYSGSDDFGALDTADTIGGAQRGKQRGKAGFHSVDEILAARRGGGLFEYLMSAYAPQSGISGVQPKVLIQDVSKFSAAEKFSSQFEKGRASVSLSSATHIVKLWEPSEFPELAANEYFCLKAASRAGLTVPACHLSQSGQALIVERFDLQVRAGGSPELGEGRYMGFEDFCVLNGVNADDKYRGSYEAKLFKRLIDYISPATSHEDLAALFKLFVLNVVIRNGDAHLKNFGLIYHSLIGPVRLAPAYDLVTTPVYIPQDSMALTLGGSTRWPSRDKLKRLGQSLCELTLSQINHIIDEVLDAVAETQSELGQYFKDSPSPDIGRDMIKVWNDGLKI